MKARLWVAGFLFLSLAGVALGQEADAVKPTVGKVQGMYARLARGVFVQEREYHTHWPGACLRLFQKYNIYYPAILPG